LKAKGPSGISARPDKTFVTFDPQVPVLMEIALSLPKALRAEMLVEKSCHLSFP
jgi:hypothetical protein